MSVTLVRDTNETELAANLGDAICAHLKAAIAAKGVARAAFSGGNTPLVLFDYLSNQDLDWARVSITLADERCVPADHADSNSKLIRQHLLQNKAAAATFYPLLCECKAGDSEPAAEKMLHQNFPEFDVVILGMGSDGHTASIFPLAAERDEALSPTGKRLSLLSNPVTANHMRITQTLPQLLNTTFLAVHIAGIEKWRLMASIVDTPQPTFPMSHFIHQSRTAVHLYCAA